MKRARTYIRSNNLLIPRPSGELLTKQRPTDRTVRAVTADDIVGLKDLLSIWSVCEDSCARSFGLVDPGDLVQIADRGVWTTVEMFSRESKEFAQGQTVQSPVKGDAADVHPRHQRAVDFAPRHAVGHDVASLADFGKETGPFEFTHGGPGVE